MVDNAKAPSLVPLPGVIADRYQVSGALGQGGMARVYRVTDSVTGRELALKQLLASAVERQHALQSLFEAEFHTLAQLSHPRVIEVYDYGVDEAGAFYTMELLDGGDLRDRSPMPFREACALIFDVCSSLALLHSRRLVHRDISPRNVRCTRDGHAKLIDFGTMVPMGHSGLVAGTPAFVAPEVLHHAALDGRADLFSLGATLYYALTRRTPFAARELRDLALAWERKPQPPSSFNPEIPPALDALTLALLSLDPAMRPRFAFEVMERLSAIAGLEREESVNVSRAYLSTPLLVGREDAMAELAFAIDRAHDGRGSGRLVRAETGLGRSRMLDACALEAKAHGAVVLRASATGSSSEAFTVVQALADQLFEALGSAVQRSARPQPAQEALFEAVADATPQDTKRSRVRTRFKRFSTRLADGLDPTEAFIQLLLQLSQRRLLVICVDDLHRCDVHSASLLAALAARIERRRLLLVLTVEAGAAESAPDAMRVVASRCAGLALSPLTRAQTEALLSSVFGAVPNLSVLTEAIHELAAGNPRACVDLTQHLVENDVLRYAGGSWTLPERIDPAVLPRSAEEALLRRLSGLAPLARWLAEAHALSPLESYSRADYLALRPDANHQSIDHALLQLISQQVLASDGSFYALSRQSWAAALTAQLDPEDRRQQHGALARLYESKPGLQVVPHLLAAGLFERGLDRLLAALDGLHDAYDLLRLARMRVVDLLATLDRAHATAVELGRPALQRTTLEAWMVGLSIFADDAYYYRFAPGWRAQLEHDSGLTLFRELGEIADPGQRLMRALQSVSERYAAMPEHDRGYPPQEAIRLLVLYVGVSIAMGSRACDRPLLTSLPDLLAPFAALSPIIEAIRLNSIASCDVSCDSRLEQGRAIWLDVYARLMQISPTELPAVLTFRHAIAYALGLVEARIGFESAMSWAELLDKDPAQHVSALYLHKVKRLHHGDFEGAEHFRQQAELAALQASVRPMFTNVVAAELWAHAAAGDLTGVKQALDRIEALAARYPGWQGSLALGQAQFQLLRGDLEAAKLAFERCLAVCAPDAGDPDRTTIAWPSCVGSYLETLDRLGLHDQARRVALDAIDVCREHGIGLCSHEIVRGLALAEAKLGDQPSAWARLEALIEEQTRLGVKGLQLGASYEACARIAIWTGDERRLQHYARLTALEYRYGSGSQLGARYERLMEEARQAGAGVLPELTDFASTAFAPTRARTRDALRDEILESMISASDQPQRAQRGLSLLCKGRGAKGGHLYLLGADGIVLAASEGGRKPPVGLREFLERYLHFEREDCESATAIATDQQLNSSMPIASWSDAQGEEYHPLVLSAEVEGVVRQIGVACFTIDGASPRQPNEAQLGAAIAAYLVGAGDIQMVTRSKH